MDLQQFVTIIRENTHWLYTPVLETHFFKLDLWSFMHLWSGMVIFAMFIAFRSKKPWLMTAALLVLYEFVEAGIVVSAFRIFYPEKFFDSISDMVVGMAGALLMFAILKADKDSKSRQLTKLWSPAILASATLSYLWVGYYGYRYNMGDYNFDGINYFTFMCWFLSGIGIILFYQILRVVFNRTYFWAQIITWSVYLPILFTLEYIAYNYVGIHESSVGTTALIFDIIHGTPTLHFFYVTSPLLYVGLFLAAKQLLSHAVEKVN